MADSSLIFKAMEDEMAHVCHELATRHNTVPLFVNYVWNEKHIRNGIVRRRMRQQKKRKCQEQYLRTYFFGRFALTNDTGVEHHPQTFPTKSDMTESAMPFGQKSEIAYQGAVQRLDNKRTHLKQNPKPADNAAVPEFKRMPPAVWIGPSALTNPCPVTDMEQLSNRLSKVFSDYPELFNHCVKVYQKRVDYYRSRRRGQKILQPDTAFHITARASIKNRRQ